MKSFYDQSAALTGFTYADLLALSNASLDASFTEQLETVLRTAPLTSYLTTSDYLILYNSICGDSHFKRPRFLLCETIFSGRRCHWHLHSVYHRLQSQRIRNGVDCR